MGSRRFVIFSALIISLCSMTPAAQQASKGGITSIGQDSLKEWLTYISSDELQGRATYSEGLGLAAGYIASHLAQWGVKPAGDDGTYLQVVKVLGVRATSRATVTVEVNGQSRTFSDGEGIAFPKNMGGKQTIVADQVQFAGYGLTLPSGTYDDYAKLDPKGNGCRVVGTRGAENRRDGTVPLAQCDGAQPRGARQGRDCDDRAGRRRRGRGRGAGSSGGGHPGSARATPARLLHRQPAAVAVVAPLPTMETSPPCSGSTRKCRPRSLRRTRSSSFSSAARR